MKFKLGHPYIIKWEDARACTSDDDPEPVLVLGIGFCVKDAQKFVTLAAEIFPDGSWSDGTTVPKSLIRKVIR